MKKTGQLAGFFLPLIMRSCLDDGIRFGPIGGVNRGLAELVGRYDFSFNKTPASMKRPIAFAAALISLTAMLKAHSAVVCEFQPNLAMNDCEYCFKQDDYGLRLYLDGKLRASSTSPDRFPRTQIAGIVYQRGVEKKNISARNGLMNLFEVCYERSAPLSAGNITLTMSEADFQEFQLGNPGRGVGKQYQFALAGDVKSGSASFFGNTLAFMAPPDWKGTASIPYVVIDDEGVQSLPGLITVEAVRETPPVPRAPLAPVVSNEDIKIALQEQRNAELLVEIKAIEIMLEEAQSEGDETRLQTASLEVILAEYYDKLQVLESMISALKKSKASREREAFLFSTIPSQPATKALIGSLLSTVAYPQSAHIRPSIRRVGTPGPAPAPIPDWPVLVPAICTYRRVRSFQGLEPGPGMTLLPARFKYPSTTKAAPRRSPRLSKLEKKRIKKVRRCSSTLGPATIRILP